SAEADAAIDHDPFALALRTEAIGSHVHANLANAAKRQEDEFIPLVLSHGLSFPFDARRRPSFGRRSPRFVYGQLRALAVAPKCTSPAVIGNREPSASRMISRPAESMVSKMPRRTTPSCATATGAPSPAAEPRQRSSTAATPRPSSHWEKV